MSKKFVANPETINFEIFDPEVKLVDSSTIICDEEFDQQYLNQGNQQKKPTRKSTKNQQENQLIINVNNVNDQINCLNRQISHLTKQNNECAKHINELDTKINKIEIEHKKQIKKIILEHKEVIEKMKSNYKNEINAFVNILSNQTTNQMSNQTTNQTTSSELLINSLETYINGQIKIPEINLNEIFIDHNKNLSYSTLIMALYGTLKLILPDIKIFVPKHNMLNNWLMTNTNEEDEISEIIKNVFDRNNLDHMINSNFMFFNYDFYIEYYENINSLEFVIHKFYNCHNMHNFKTCVNNDLKSNYEIHQELINTQIFASANIIDNYNCNKIMYKMTEFKNNSKSYDDKLLSNKTILENELTNVYKFIHPIIYLYYLLSKPHNEILNYFKQIDKYKFDELMESNKQKDQIIDDVIYKYDLAKLDHNNEIEKMKLNHENEINELKMSYEKIKSDHENEINELKKDYENIISYNKILYNLI